MTTKTREEWLDERIAATRAEIEAREAAVDALSVQGVQEYWIDSAQSRMKVVRANVTEIQQAIKALYQRLADLERARGGQAVQWRPAW